MKMVGVKVYQAAPRACVILSYPIFDQCFSYTSAPDNVEISPTFVFCLGVESQSKEQEPVYVSSESVRGIEPRPTLHSNCDDREGAEWSATLSSAAPRPNAITVRSSDSKKAKNDNDEL